MKLRAVAVGWGVVCSVLVASVPAAAQAPVAAQAPAAQAAAEVYHIHFTKAVPGQSAALADALLTPDPKAPMPGHVLVLRHRQGDDWDYCVIEHLGPKATVDPAPAAPAPGRDLRSWHTDTFVSGPSWAEFTKAMGLEQPKAGAVYSVAVWRAAPGQRDALEKQLRTADPSSKVQVGRVLLTHLEGGPWQFLSIEQYASWQDFATDLSAPVAEGWHEVRKYGTYHHDTLADRIAK